MYCNTNICRRRQIIQRNKICMSSDKKKITRKKGIKVHQFQDVLVPHQFVCMSQITITITCFLITTKIKQQELFIK